MRPFRQSYRSRVYRRSSNVRKPARKAKRSNKKRARRSIVGSLLTTAANSLISAIPGSGIIKTAADFVFKALKITSQTITDELDLYALDKDTTTVGLQQVLNLRRINFLLNSPEIDIQPGIPTDPNKTLQKKYVNDRYILYRFKSVTISLVPQNDLGHRQGQWAMFFTSYVSVDHRDDIKTDCFNRSIGYNDVIRMPGSVNGPQNTTLTLTYTPQPADGMAFLPGRSEWGYGILIIAYQDLAKPNSDDFTPDKFAASLRLSADVRKITKRLSTYTPVSTEVESLLDGVSHFAYDGNVVYAVPACDPPAPKPKPSVGALKLGLSN